jgi:hypothetical protein
MTEPWFTEVPSGLAFLALLSLLALLDGPISQGRFKTPIMTIWTVAIATALGLLASSLVALAVQQPPHVVRSLALLSLVFGFAFGVSFPALRRVYREAELRKTIAADL